MQQAFAARFIAEKRYVLGDLAEPLLELANISKSSATIFGVMHHGGIGYSVPADSAIQFAAAGSVLRNSQVGSYGYHNGRRHSILELARRLYAGLA